MCKLTKIDQNFCCSLIHAFTPGCNPPRWRRWQISWSTSTLMPNQRKLCLRYSHFKLVHLRSCNHLMKVLLLFDGECNEWCSNLRGPELLSLLFRIVLHFARRCAINADGIFIIVTVLKQYQPDANFKFPRQIFGDGEPVSIVGFWHSHGCTTCLKVTKSYVIHAPSPPEKVRWMFRRSWAFSLWLCMIFIPKMSHAGSFDIL